MGSPNSFGFLVIPLPLASDPLRLKFLNSNPVDLSGAAGIFQIRPSCPARPTCKQAKRGTRVLGLGVQEVQGLGSGTDAVVLRELNTRAKHLALK